MQHSTGMIGWVGLTAYVIAWDRFADETLSMAFGKALLHPRVRWPTIAVWAAVTGHLFGIIPERVDPIHHLGRAIVRKA